MINNFATSRFNIAHLAHRNDDTYPLAGVLAETDAVLANGFPLRLILAPGTHVDNAKVDLDHDGNPENDWSQTNLDVRVHLLPLLGLGWHAP